MSEGSNEKNGAPLRAGLIGGSVAGGAASLANLPLHAPIDTYFNSGTVTVGALIAGVAAGLVWRVVASRERGALLYVGALAIVAMVVAAAAFAAASTLDRSVSYVVPLAGVVFGTLAVVPPLLSQRLGRRGTSIAIGALIFALALGGALSGQGDAESGRLELPPRTQQQSLMAMD
jgi:peptidoglycan/LPS O-acetylase OafA/YrhL